MVSSEIELQLAVAEADSDAERLAQLTRRLMRGFRDLGVESVERPPGEAPPEDAKWKLNSRRVGNRPRPSWRHW